MKKLHQNRKDGKTQMAVRIPLDYNERMRNIIHWTPGMTVTEFIRQALENIIKEKEDEYGGKFPPRALDGDR